ncbi:hypothetical protein [Roseibium sp.]|uniref:hypothetical protein n=1 Tax=Roseibium sp. TaxID=1936156 RepID=UPI003BA90D6E
MYILALTKKALMCFSGLIALAFSLPIFLASIMSLFWGRAPFALLAIVYAQLFAWPFEVARELDNHVSYRSTIERSSVFGWCDHMAVALEPDAQAQPFSQLPGDKDWQPEVDGSPEMQPNGQEAWRRTPLSEERALHHARRMRNCGFSDGVVDKALQAMQEPGSWVAYSTRGMDKVFLYSRSLDFALIYSNET